MKDFSETGVFLYLVVVILSSIHVHRDCKQLGEKPLLHVSGTIILWPFYYLIGWLWIWPASLRRKLSGGAIEDLAQAKAQQRVQKRKGHPLNNENYTYCEKSNP